jgi:hypothetical protein
MGGVFINYRSVDNPLGAAAIHDALVSKFGNDQVFRDVASLAAGTHYPTAIQDALDEADVLVAVIGPQWLTLTNDITGERLIDQHRDWVRQEIARAFQRKIPVVPVLLKDTPADAIQPTAADLPDEIRPLAAIQAFKFSQRRFHEDLERLVTRLTQLTISRKNHDRKPTDNRAAPSRSSLPPLTKLLDALEAVPSVRHEDTRLLLLGQLRPEISRTIKHHPDRRTHILEILTRCLDYDDGVADLIDAIAVLEPRRSKPFRHLVDSIAEALPSLREKI